MFKVYVLFSKKDRRLYIGCTNNLERRIREHERGAVCATRYRRPLTLIHTEKFPDKVGAFVRERFLKSLWGAREKKKILRQFLESQKMVT